MRHSGAADLDEAWLVELADWQGQTAQRVAATIGVREEPGVPLAQTLAEALRSRHMLLVLDTCEHQVSDCATLVQLLLARCPWLRIVATSREPLRVRGETSGGCSRWTCRPTMRQATNWPATKRSGCSRRVRRAPGPASR
jgi:predicted ATPase